MAPKPPKWICDPIVHLRKELAIYADEDYARFVRATLPNDVKTPVVGVRVPKIRAILKTIPTEFDEAILHAILEPTSKITPLESLEERVAVAFILGRMKAPLERKYGLITAFLPYVDSWAVCDALASVVKPHSNEKEKFWSFLDQFYMEGAPYARRYALVTTLKYYIERDWIADMIERVERVAKLKIQDHAVNMAVAWLLCEVMVKFPDEAFKYLRECSLDDLTFNKALGKIRDSYRIPSEIKEEALAMRRRPR
ncbi:MAG: DNA alkylation repair protein [Thermoguttaceae bacterium]|jgi:3-methyladenine DNA glycosylase AlkD